VLFTVVVPIANTLPDAGADVTLAEQLSTATGANVTAAPRGLVAATVIGPGHATTGPSASLTVTVNEHAGDSPSALFAFELTFVVPTLKALPDGGRDTAVTSGHTPSTFGANATTALHLPGALFTVMGAGHWIVGSGSWKFGVKSSVSVASAGTVPLYVALYSSLPKKFGASQRALLTATSRRSQSGARPVPSL
jgi:hypothetical protein